MTKSNSILKFIESIYEKPDKKKKSKSKNNSKKNKPKKLKTKRRSKNKYSNKRHLNSLPARYSYYM